MSNIPFICTIFEVTEKYSGSVTFIIKFEEIKEITRYSTGIIGIYYDYFGAEKILAIKEDNAFNFENWYDAQIISLKKKEKNGSKINKKA